MATTTKINQSPKTTLLLFSFATAKNTVEGHSPPSLVSKLTWGKSTEAELTYATCAMKAFSTATMLKGTLQLELVTFHGESSSYSVDESGKLGVVGIWFCVAGIVVNLCVDESGVVVGFSAEFCGMAKFLSVSAESSMGSGIVDMLFVHFSACDDMGSKSVHFSASDMGFAGWPFVAELDGVFGLAMASTGNVTFPTVLHCDAEWR